MQVLVSQEIPNPCFQIVVEPLPHYSTQFSKYDKFTLFPPKNLLQIAVKTGFCKNKSMI